nr:MAG TPA: hypothetical protein [Caudoviricetes sp.]
MIVDICRYFFMNIMPKYGKIRMCRYGRIF